MTRPLASAFAFAAAAGLYLLMAGSLSRNEDVTSAAIGGAAAAFTFVVRRQDRRGLRLVPPPLGAIGRTLSALPADCFRVGLALLRAILTPGQATRATTARQALRFGDGPEDAGRRALVTLAASLAPNGYVIDGSREGEWMGLHRLTPVAAASGREWPV